MDPAKQRDDIKPQPTAEAIAAAQYYQRRAAECRQVAAISIDEESREEWLRLANQWAYLALHAQRSASAT